MKILVSGGAGFIGHNIVRRLESLGNEVIILDNLKAAPEALYEERLEGIKAHILKSDISHNIARTHVSNRQPDIIIHLASAANSKAVNNNPEAATDSMVTGLENMLLAASRNECVKKFIFVSSSMVYGDFQNSYMSENAPKTPINLYGTLKLAGEKMTELYAKKHGFEYVIIRPSAVYGPRDTDDRVIATFFKQAMANKEIVVRGDDTALDFTYVDDLAEGIVQAMSTNLKVWEPAFNLTRGQSHTIKHAADLICAATNSKSEIEISGPDATLGERGELDCRRARKAFDFCPQTDLEEGLELYYEWIKQFHSV